MVSMGVISYECEHSVKLARIIRATLSQVMRCNAGPLHPAGGFGYNQRFGKFCRCFALIL
jgi:hypothetical protein